MAVEYSCLASTGILTPRPGSTNTVPGRVQFTLDIRSESDEDLMKVERELVKDFEQIAKGENIGGLQDGGVSGVACHVEWMLVAPSKAVCFDRDCIQCVEESAREVLGENADNLMMRMISGAGE